MHGRHDRVRPRAWTATLVAALLLLGVGLGGCDDFPRPKVAHDLAGGDDGGGGDDLGVPPDRDRDLAIGPADFAGAGGRDLSGGGSRDLSGSGVCHLVINEVQTTDVTAADEFVELFNPCADAQDLTGWQIVHRSAAGTGDVNDQIALQDAVPPSIDGFGYLLVVGPDYIGPNNLRYASPHWALDGGGVGLRDPHGTLIDSVAYATPVSGQPLPSNGFAEGGVPVAAPPAGSSIMRLPNGQDTDHNARDFQVASVPTPGQFNTTTP